MSDPAARLADPQGVLIGLSGGVDSAVAALLLKQKGYRVTGVTFTLWTDPASHDDRACTTPAALEKARAVAEQLDLPHVTVDAAESFYSEVVRYFVDEYERGRTPNPCCKCNARVRFGLLRDVADGLGLARLATGHYARLLGDPPALARAVDRGKDQSYVLAEVPPELLASAVFPLGELTKAEVRRMARVAGLVVRDESESQEICFIPDNDHRRFLRERLGERPGAVVDDSGRELGRHGGTYNFTVGQRKGLGVAGAEPLYVVEVCAEGRRVVVGSNSDTAVGAVTIGAVVRHSAPAGTGTSVQLRSTGGAVPARSAGPTSILLEAPAVGIAPGQTAVLYEGDRVLLGGTVVSTARWRGECSRKPSQNGPK